MTVTDQIKVLHEKIKPNQVQYDLGREAAQISELSSKDLLEKYEYLTGEYWGHKTSVFGKVKFEYSPLVMVLTNNTESKANKNKAYNKNKQNKYLVYNPQHSFARFKDFEGFEDLSLDSMYKRLYHFKQRFNRLKTVNPETDENKNLQKQVLDDVGDLFNELYYIYKDKYSEEKDGLNTKAKKNYYKNWDLLMIISTSLKKKKKNRLVKNLMKKKYLKTKKGWFDKT